MKSVKKKNNKVCETRGETLLGAGHIATQQHTSQQEAGNNKVPFFFLMWKAFNSLY